MVRTSTDESIRNILVCEDHPFVQLGLKVSLTKAFPHLESLRIASTGGLALQLAKKQKPDLAVVDLGLPDMAGADLIQGLQKLWWGLKILVVTSCDNPTILLRTKKLGVAGIIQKSSSLEHLTSCLSQITSDGRVFLDPAVKAILQEHDEIEFTPKEFEVLQEITQGLSNQQIADKMGCAVTTVRYHRANILHKTGIRTGAELAAWFLQGQRKRN